MSIYGTAVDDAIARLLTFYNASAYNASTNTGGLAVGGQRENLIPLIQDLANTANAVATQAENITDVADDAATITENIDAVTAVAADLDGDDYIGAVGAGIANVNAVGADLLGDDDVGTVAADLSGSDNIGTVASGITNVNAVGADLLGDDDVGTVAADLSGSDNIGTVASGITNVNAVGADLLGDNYIGAIGADLAGDDNIGTVGQNIADVIAAAATIAPNKLDATRAPTVNDDGVDSSGIGVNFLTLSRWFRIDVTPVEVYLCTNPATGAASWVQLSLTPDELGALAVLNTVGSAQIDDESITYAKMQHVSATNKILGRSSGGSGDVEEIDCTAAGRALLDDANAAAQRTTLGCGSMATQDANAVAITGGTIGVATKFRRYNMVIREQGEVTEEDDKFVITFQRAYRLHNIDVVVSADALEVDLKKNDTEIGGLGDVAVSTTLAETAVDDSSNAYIDFARGDTLTIDKHDFTGTPTDLLVYLDIEER